MTKLSQHQAGFALLWTVSLLIGWRPLIDTLALSARDDEYTYILLIIPISAALIFLEWRPLRKMVRSSFRTGSVLLAIALLVACSAIGWRTSFSTDVQLSIRMIALVLTWVGAFVFCFGIRASRLVQFPLCFFLGLVPLPQAALHAIVDLLQLGSAGTAHMLFAACGVPAAQDGVLLTIPGLTVQVAAECSSIRSSSILLVTTMVLAHLLLRSPWSKALLIGIAIPLSVVKNGLRIFAIAMLGTRVDPGYLTGRLHHQGGVIFLGIALIAVFLLLWLLRRGEGVSSGDSLCQKKTAPAPGS